MTIGAARLGRAAALLGAALALYAIVWLPTIGHRAIGSLEPLPTMGETVERLRAGLASGSPLRRHYLRLMEDTNTSSVGVRAEFLGLFPGASPDSGSNV